MLGFLFTVLGVAMLQSGCSAASGSSSAKRAAAVGGASYALGTGGTGSANLGADSGHNGGKVVATEELLAGIKDAACSGWASELALAPPIFEFVVDTSASMTEFAPRSNLTKWGVTREAIAAALEEFLPGDTAVGALFYPNQATIPNHLDEDPSSLPLPVSHCINVAAMVKVGPLGGQGSVQRAALAQSLANVQPSGGTPTDDAYTYALSNAMEPAIRAYPDYVPYMVLITDGQPTILQGCKGTGEAAHPVDWMPIIEHIGGAAASSSSVKTFIIGAPGSDAQSTTGEDGRPGLSRAARAGKTQRTEDCSDEGPNYCHYDLTQSTDLASDLKSGLRDITRKIPCRFSMPAAPPNCELAPATLNVIYQQNYASGIAEQTWIIGQSDAFCGADSADDGWYIDSATNMIILCPATCQTVQTDLRPRLEILSGCHAVFPPPQ